MITSLEVGESVSGLGGVAFDGRGVIRFHSVGRFRLSSVEEEKREENGRELLAASRHCS